MSNELDKYQGYNWIKVKRAKSIDIDGTMYVPETHHIEEVSFMIEEIKKLAAKVDKLTRDKNYAQLEAFERIQKIAQQNYENQLDYLPYEEDDR